MKRDEIAGTALTDISLIDWSLQDHRDQCRHLPGIPDRPQLRHAILLTIDANVTNLPGDVEQFGPCSSAWVGIRFIELEHAVQVGCQPEGRQIAFHGIHASADVEKGRIAILGPIGWIMDRAFHLEAYCGIDGAKVPAGNASAYP